MFHKVKIVLVFLQDWKCLFIPYHKFRSGSWFQFLWLSWLSLHWSNFSHWSLLFFFFNWVTTPLIKNPKQLRRIIWQFLSYFIYHNILLWYVVIKYLRITLHIFFFQMNSFEIFKDFFSFSSDAFNMNHSM